MSLLSLRNVLKRAAGLFEAGGAKEPAADLHAVEKLLADSGDVTVDEFVERTRDAIRAPKPSDMAPLEIVMRLNEIGVDRGRFEQFFAELKVPAFNKEMAKTTASLFTGARPTAWKSKPQALDAIRKKFEERVYLAGKAELNRNVTPW